MLDVGCCDEVRWRRLVTRRRLLGPVTIGDNFLSGDDCVVFRATVEDNVTVRTGATVAGESVLREGTIVPEGAVVTTQEEADALPRS